MVKVIKCDPQAEVKKLLQAIQIVVIGDFNTIRGIIELDRDVEIYDLTYMPSFWLIKLGPFLLASLKEQLTPDIISEIIAFTNSKEILDPIFFFIGRSRSSYYSNGSLLVTSEVIDGTVNSLFLRKYDVNHEKFRFNQKLVQILQEVSLGYCRKCKTVGFDDVSNVWDVLERFSHNEKHEFLGNFNMVEGGTHFARATTSAGFKAAIITVVVNDSDTSEETIKKLQQSISFLIIRFVQFAYKLKRQPNKSEISFTRKINLY